MTTYSDASRAAILAAAERYRETCEAEAQADDLAFAAFTARGPSSVPGPLDDDWYAADAAMRAAAVVRLAAGEALLAAARGDL